MQPITFMTLSSVLVLGLSLPADAVSTARQCRQACDRLIAACANAGRSFGDLRGACRQAVLRRCKREGPQVCGSFCGDGIIAVGEACDGTNLVGKTCQSLGFASGTLACSAKCDFVTSGCVSPLLLPLVCATCGNGRKDGGESCDGTDMAGATCATLGFTGGGALRCTALCGFDPSECIAAPRNLPASGQTSTFGADKNDGMPDLVPVPDDGAVRAGPALAYVDNGSGTITDLNTGLMWEKKSNDGGLHDKDNTYVWSGLNGDQETIWEWLDDVNNEGGGGFAGHRDWRIPNVRELMTIINYGAMDPPVSGEFHSACTEGCTVLDCSCTRGAPSDGNLYWSSSSEPFGVSGWTVQFREGSVFAAAKFEAWHIRAVRR